jgi:hypothetical protein
LMLASLESEKTKKNKFDENQRIIVRYFLDSSRTRLSKLVVDEKFSLVLELKMIQKIILLNQFDWQHILIINQLYGHILLYSKPCGYNQSIVSNKSYEFKNHKLK